MQGSDQQTRLSGLWQGYAALWLSGIENRYPAIAFQSQLARAVSETEWLTSRRRQTVAAWRSAGHALAAAAAERTRLDRQADGALPTQILENRRRHLKAAMAAAAAERRQLVGDAAALLEQLAALSRRIGQLRAQRPAAAALISDEVILAGLDVRLAALAELETAPRDLLEMTITGAEDIPPEEDAPAGSGGECGLLSDSEICLATRAMLYVARAGGDSPQSLALIQTFFESGIETLGLPLFDDLRESLGEGLVMDAARFCSTANRELILKLCLLTAYADGDCSLAEWRVLQELADDLAVPAPRLAELDAGVRDRLLQELSALPDTVSVAQVARGLQPPV
ncbi:MAG TPA: hypothetical protein VFW42_07750 [Fluviicoccus sp.]|nr:hypothetical protein [Fluviicoccus sp.]